MILRHFFSDIGYLSSFLISKNFQNFFHPTSILRQYLLLFTIDRSSFVHYHSPYPKIFKISSILRQYLLLFRASSFFIPKNFQNFFHPTSILRQYLLLFTIDRSSFVHPYFSYSKISKISSIDPISFINRSILFPHCSSHPKISKISFIQHRSFANICFVHPHSSYPKICKISSTQHRSFANICYFSRSIDPLSSIIIVLTQKFSKFLPSFANIYYCFVHPHSSYPKISKISSIQHRSFANIYYFSRLIDPLSCILIFHTQKFPKFLPSIQYLSSIDRFSFLIVLHTQKFPKFLSSNIDPSPISVSCILILHTQKFAKFLPLNIDPSSISVSFYYRSIFFQASSYFIPKNFQNFFHPTSIPRQYPLLITIDRSSFASSSFFL